MKEVLSIPAGGTFSNIKAYNIHAFPYPRTYMEAQYVTFRAPNGGQMDMLYSVIDHIVLDPFSDNIANLISDFDNKSKDRMINYIAARKTTKLGFEKKDSMYTFYILKEEQNLPHKPRPQGRNTVGHTYYTYEEITCGNEEVIVESKLQK